MSPAESDQPTIRRWRRAFLGFYLTFCVLVGLWILLSVLSVHCGWQRPALGGPQISPRADNPRELRRCHKRLARLLTDLHDKTFTLQARALKYRIDPATEWRNWSNSWRARWRRLERRCRLSQLAGTGTSKEIDHMYAVHSALAKLQLGYSGVVDRFVERFADRLRELRKELAQVRVLIDRRRPKKN